MQGTEIEGGGFRGRTNKLVDGCYSWWVGGSFALIEEALGVARGVILGAEKVVDAGQSKEEGDWTDIESKREPIEIQSAS